MDRAVSMFVYLPLLISGIVAIRHRGSEPECSRYDFAEKTLEKLVRVEHAAELREQEQRRWEDRLQTTLAAIVDERSESDELVKKLGGMIASVETKLQEKEVEWDKMLRQKLDEYESNIQSLIENMKQPKIVVFKAKGTNSQNIVEDKAIVYTDVIINVGNGYDVTTGLFTAPVPGSYMFMCQVCSTSSQWAHVRIVVNENNEIESTSYHGTDGNGTCMTFTGVAELSTGDTVCIEGSYLTSSRIVAEDPFRWNSFSGVLIASA